MKPIIITPPSEEPLTLAEAKECLRVTYNYEDASITEMARAAREACENYCNRAFLTQKLMQILPISYPIPEDGYGVRWGNVVEIESLQLVAKGEVVELPLTRGVHWWKASAPSHDKIKFDLGLAQRIMHNANVEEMRLTYVSGMPKVDLVAKHPVIMESIRSTLNLIFDTRNITNIGLPIAVRHALKPYKILAIEEV